MAIKIPSVSIYDIKYVLPKNYIDKVECKNNDLEYSVDFLALVETSKYDLIGDTSWEINSQTNSDNDKKTTSYNLEGAHLEINLYAFVWNTYANIQININKYKNNNLYRILKLYEGKNEDDEPFIKHRIVYTKYYGDAINISGDHFTESNVQTMEGDGTIEENDFSATFTAGFGWVPRTITATATPTDLQEIRVTSETDDAYTISARVRVKQTTMTYNTNNPNNVVGQFTRIEPKMLEISFYGDIEKYEKVEIPLTYGNGNNVFATESNELLASTSFLYGLFYPEINEVKSDNIINKYRNGKETIELLCQIGEYYDTDNNLVISTKSGTKNTFEIGDIVVPYIYTNNGDTPISTATNSTTPKSYLVCGVDFIFDGAVWQKIFLQEN